MKKSSLISSNAKKNIQSKELFYLVSSLRTGLLLASILIIVGSCASPPPPTTPETFDQVPITQDPFLASEDDPAESEQTPAQRLAEITLEFEEAIRTGNLDRALDLYPSYGQALKDAGLDETDLPILLGNLLLSSGDIAEASAIFEELLDSSPENLEILVPLSIIALVQNDQPRLTRLYDEILAIDPNNSDALTGKGILAYSREQHNQAIDFLTVHYWLIMEISKPYSTEHKHFLP